MREMFSSTLVKLAKANPELLLLTGDHGYGLFDKFRSECPDQYINAGIAEQNMVGMAAGLAKVGFRPFVYGLSSFVPVRVIEQIKLDVAHDKLPVSFIGDGAGFVYSHLGTSHQSTEDIACTRSIPNLAIYSPGDRFELEACMNEIYSSASSSYIRLCKSDRGDVHSSKIEFRNIHRIRDAAKGSLVTLVATGSMLKTAVEIADNDLPFAGVLSVSRIKPFDVQDLLPVISSKDNILVVLEEHSIYGGLGSLISEIVAELGLGFVLRVGVNDRFSKLCGSYEYLLEEHGLDRVSITEKIKTFLHRLDKPVP
jgi:transketolase